MKQGDYWTRTDQEKANTYTEHLVFTPNIREIDPGGRDRF